ncbi:solute carrier family 46 member 3 [Callorhinchus milii]|uniref:solute carrier family 46 member 3 n=1 Tax=Callorhinchus milii TaxID=7868 RepID=UPI001C3F6C91|nr:solute carrier family 46 member 3 [Callorhinchus milii]
MKRLYLVEPVIALTALASLPTYPLIQQYIYRRTWEEQTNSSYIDHGNVTFCNQNRSDPAFVKQEEVQKMTSHFFMCMELAVFLPGFIVTFILGSYSDRHGRKLSLLLPSIGSLFNSLAFLAASYFSWPINLLFIPVILTSCFGGFTTLIGGIFAYVADVCTGKQRNMRMALVDMIIGVMGGVGVLSSGYFLNAVGFNWPFLTITLINFVNIMYIVFFLEETVNKSENESNGVSGFDRLREIFSGISVLYTSSDVRKRIQISLLLFIFSMYILANFGSASLFILYELNAPLCWNEILIGYGSGAGLLVFLTSFVGVALFSCCLNDVYIVLIGIFSFVGAMIMTIFATTTPLMFLVRLVSLFAMMPLPVIRSMLSKIALPSEQGVLFACVACLENLSGTLSSVIFNSIYAATVSHFASLSFLISACLCIIPISVLCFLLCWKSEDEDATHLIDDELPALLENEEEIVGS